MHAMGKDAPTGATGGVAAAHAAPPIASTQTDTLATFTGASQALDIAEHGASTQDMAPPDTDIAAGPTDIVETVNSTIDVFNRTGGLLGTDDLNTFLSVVSGHESTDPRIVYDSFAQRWFLTLTQAPTPFSCSNFAAPVLIAVSSSSNPLPFSSWIVYDLPLVTPGTLLADQPGLGFSDNTLAVTWNNYNCSGTFLGSDIDILQRTDLELDATGPNSDVPFTDDSFAPQPIQSFGRTTTQYVVANDSDCAPSVCSHPFTEVDPFTGTPEGRNVGVVPSHPAMTPTLVDPAYLGTPPAEQNGTPTTINTDDDRFLNAVWQNGQIWAAGGTECTPAGDSAPRSCLDYVGVTASSTGVVNPTVTQINNIGVTGSYLYYPALSIDSAGDVFTVFDESSGSTFPTIVSATIAAGGATLSAFQTVHTSTGFYDPDFACQSIASTNACRWGDYSGAAQDPSNPRDVWVVSEAEDGSTSSACDPVQASQCWSSDIALLTLASPTITSVTPASGPVAGGQTVTVRGADFGTDTTVTFNALPITISGLTASSFTLVTPSSVPAGGTVQIQVTDSIGASVENAASAYTYVGLANYVPVTPYRLLDTRNVGGPLGQGTIRPVLVVGGPVLSSATAAVLNITEVSGSASSLLTVYPFNTTRPNASNLNFPAHTVIANLVTVTLSSDGKIDIYNALGSVNVLVDVEGFFTPQPVTDVQGLFHPFSPVRVCDTRKPANCGGRTAVGSARSIVVTVASAGRIPNDSTAEAAVVNLTGVAGSASTFLSLFPPDVNGNCNFTGTSTINLLAGAVVANRVMVQLGPATTGGPTDALCVYNAAGTINVLIDADGWYGSATAPASPAGFQYQALAPTRICDTRVLSASCAKGAIGGALSRVITVAGHAGVPAFSSPTVVVAIIANLTGVVPTATTYLAFYPGNLTQPPGVSDVNLNPGVVLPNLAVVQLDTIAADPHDGEAFLYNAAGSVNAIIDIEGWFQ